MEIETSGAEGPVVLVAIRRFKVTRSIKAGRVPEAAAEVCDKREVGP